MNPGGLIRFYCVKNAETLTQKVFSVGKKKHISVELLFSSTEQCAAHFNHNLFFN